MGVWIETLTDERIIAAWRVSHPAWVCGLRQIYHLSRQYYECHTLRGCVDWNMNWHYGTDLSRESHPAWVCGLKLLPMVWTGGDAAVTPCVGVWIETEGTLEKSIKFGSHPAWVCGLKLKKMSITPSRVLSHPAWVCGLKHENQTYR